MRTVLNNSVMVCGIVAKLIVYEHTRDKGRRLQLLSTVELY